MDKWQALSDFFNGFGVSAYEVGCVPDTAVFPRITYESRTASIDEPIQIDASVWDYNESSFANVDRIVDSIEKAINIMDCPRIDGGRCRVYKGTPFAQRMSDENPNIRRTILHINFEFLTE